MMNCRLKINAMQEKQDEYLAEIDLAEKDVDTLTRMKDLT